MTDAPDPTTELPVEDRPLLQAAIEIVTPIVEADHEHVRATTAELYAALISGRLGSERLLAHAVHRTMIRLCEVAERAHRVFFCPFCYGAATTDEERKALPSFDAGPARDHIAGCRHNPTAQLIAEWSVARRIFANTSAADRAKFDSAARGLARAERALHEAAIVQTPRCELLADDLSAYADGELNEQGRAAVIRAHLAHCAACRRTLLEHAQINALMSTANPRRSP